VSLLNVSFFLFKASTESSRPSILNGLTTLVHKQIATDRKSCEDQNTTKKVLVKMLVLDEDAILDQGASRDIARFFLDILIMVGQVEVLVFG